MWRRIQGARVSAYAPLLQIREDLETSELTAVYRPCHAIWFFGVQSLARAAAATRVATLHGLNVADGSTTPESVFLTGSDHKPIVGPLRALLTLLEVFDVRPHAPLVVLWFYKS